MSVQAEPASTSLLSGIGIRQIRLASGLILFAYVVSHFINHALGNISLATMEEALLYQIAFWRSWPITILFYGAALAHIGLGVWALYERRQFRWKAIEPLQLVLGLSIPALIVAHLVGVRLAAALFDHEKLYAQNFFAYWIVWPYMASIQYAVLIVSWVHGCIGLYFWLRMKLWFRPATPYLFAVALLIPTLAILGLYQGSRTVVQDSASREWRAENLSRRSVGTAADQAALDQIFRYFLFGYAGLIVLVFAARGVRVIAERRGGMIRLSYGNGVTVRVNKGLSVLEASMQENVPHSSVCGGRARCSTCRIRVVGDCSKLPEPSSREAFVLHRVGAAADPAIRLACQLRPRNDLSFVPLFPAQLATSLLHAGQQARVGQERYLVNMFVDMRGSTKLAEKRLPFDTVFIVNRFLTAVSQAVIECGGAPNQFVGDGQLALFGLATDPRTACRQAIRAAALISANVDELNTFLSHDLREPIRFGIGIHGGEVIIGDIGYRDHMVFTALGDPVNVTARLQDMTKALGCEVVLSEEVRKTAGLAEDALPTQEVPIRGRAEPMIVRTALKAESLSALVVDVEQVAA